VAGAALAPQIEGGTEQVRGQAGGAAGERHDEVGQPLGEDLTPAAAHPAEEPTDVEMEDDTVPTAGQSRERTLVPGMRALGAALAKRAARPAPRRDDLTIGQP
jgi:hypothetical protein